MTVFDTNLIIALLNGHQNSLELYQKTFTADQLAISIISYCEILCGLESQHHDKAKTALNDFLILPFDHPDIARAAALWRCKRKISLADAIIAATCQQHDALFYTFDKDFKKLSQTWIHVLDF